MGQFAIWFFEYFKITGAKGENGFPTMSVDDLTLIISFALVVYLVPTCSLIDVSPKKSDSTFTFFLNSDLNY